MNERQDMNMEEPIIKRIHKLLRLANDRGATRAEAENAMAMAQRLMTKYNISVANVSDNPAAQTRIHHEAFFTRKANFNVADRLIMNLLVNYYKVRIIYRIKDWGKEILIVGTPDKVEIAKYVHGFLRKVFFRAWNEYKRTNCDADKNSFYRGMFLGISQRMKEAETQSTEEATSESLRKYEIVLGNEQEAINRYIGETFGRLRHSSSKLRQNLHERDFMAGHDKGRTVQINTAIKG